jgi:pyruvate kinase
VITRHREKSLFNIKLFQDVKVGDTLLLDDGKIDMVVTEVKGKKILARVRVGGFLTSKKGINLPTSSITAEVITKKDIEDARFALAHGVDFLALSFVKTEKDIKKLRKLVVASKSPEAKIIAKVERHEAIADIDNIIAEADAIMVARGDLGIEVSAQDVPIVQKQIIRKCLAVGKPCIVATQMLESMIQNPRSTRAETSDIANAILDGADAVMLSGETSVGKYPLNAVKAMKAVALNTEEWMERDNIVIGRRIPRDVTLISEAIAQAGVQISRELGTKYLVAGTASGSNARELSKFRPHCLVIAVTSKEVVARQLALVWGVRPMLMSYNSNREMSAKMNRYLLKNKLAEKGDKLTIVSGLTKNKIGGTNLIRVHVVE